MNEKFIDLHTHSNMSDGTDSPSKLVSIAKKKGLCAIALTDHDTVSGLEEAVKAGHNTCIEVIPGIEFSLNYGVEIHVLGLFIDYTNSELTQASDFLMQTRNLRNEKIAERLNELGIKIDKNEIPISDKSTITRAHFANLLISKGYCKDKDEALSKYLDYDAPAYVKRESLPVKDCITLIHNAGGIAILAHLNQMKIKDCAELESLLYGLKCMGLDGIEGVYHDYDNDFIIKCRKLCRKYDFVISGGSDYHGKNKVNELGYANGKKIPAIILEKMKEYRISKTHNL